VFYNRDMLQYILAYDPTQPDDWHWLQQPSPLRGQLNHCCASSHCGSMLVLLLSMVGATVLFSVLSLGFFLLTW